MKRWCCVVVGAVVAIAWTGCASSKTAKPATAQIDSIRSTASPETRQFSQTELQALVMAMADSYVSSLVPAITLVELEITSPRERFGFNQLKYILASAIFSVAAGPSPETSLLDMLVLVSLQPFVLQNRIENPDTTDTMRRAGPQLLMRFRQAEQQVWLDAGRVLTAEQQQDLRSLIDEWIKANPGAITAAFVRFSDFAELRDVGRAEAASGLLAEVGNATRAVDDVRLMGERGLWLSTRMPLLVGLQVEHTLYDVAMQAEVQRLVTDSDQASDAVEQIGRDVHILREQLPEHREAIVRDVEAMQKRVIDHLMNRVADERQAIVDQLDSKEEMVTRVLADLRETIESANMLANSTKGTLTTADVIVSRFDKESGETREPLDMKDVADAAQHAALAADELTELLEVSQGLLAAPEWDARVRNLESAVTGVKQGGEDWIALTTTRGLILILAFFVGLAGYRWLSVKVIRR